MKDEFWFCGSNAGCEHNVLSSVFKLPLNYEPEGLPVTQFLICKMGITVHFMGLL